jgi:hypothetical protein
VTDREAGTAPETRTDEEICRYLGRKSISKLALVLIHDTMYRRETDGVWYRVESITDE